MAYHLGQLDQRPQRSHAGNYRRSNMQTQAYRNGNRNGGSQSINTSFNNDQVANANSIGNPYQTNGNLIQGAHQYSPSYVNHEGQPFVSPPTARMQQRNLFLQQAQPLYNTLQFTPAQLAYKNYQEDQPLREAVAKHRGEKIWERSRVFVAYCKSKWYSPKYLASYEPCKKTLEEWGREEVDVREYAQKLERTIKDIAEQKAAIALKAEGKAAIKEGEVVVKEGGKPAIRKANIPYSPVHPERVAEYEELFGDHNSKLDPNDGSLSPARNLSLPVTDGSFTAQLSGGSTQDMVKRVVKRGREDDLVDDHIVKRPRLAATEMSSVRAANSTKVEPLWLSATVDAPVVSQATLAEQIPKRILKRGREEELDEEHDAKRLGQDAVKSTSPEVPTETNSSSSRLISKVGMASESLAPFASEVSTPYSAGAVLSVNGGASSTKINNPNSDELSMAQPDSISARVRSSLLGSTPPAFAIQDIVPAISDTFMVSPVSQYSPGLSSDASPFSPISPLQAPAL